MDISKNSFMTKFHFIASKFIFSHDVYSRTFIKEDSPWMYSYCSEGISNIENRLLNLKLPYRSLFTVAPFFKLHLS